MKSNIDIDKEVKRANDKINKARRGLAQKLAQYISGKRAEVSRAEQGISELESHRDNAQEEISRAELALQTVGRDKGNGQ